MIYPHNGVIFGHRRSEVLIYVTIWVSLENVLSIRNQTQCVFHIHEMLERFKPQRQKIDYQKIGSEGWVGRDGSDS